MSAAVSPAPRRRRAVPVVAALVVLALLGYGAWHFFLAGSRLPPGLIGVSGRIEGDDAAVGAKISGRIREITVREGDHVEAGQVIAVLDDAQIRARSNPRPRSARPRRGCGCRSTRSRCCASSCARAR